MHTRTQTHLRHLALAIIRSTLRPSLPPKASAASTRKSESHTTSARVQSSLFMHGCVFACSLPLRREASFSLLRSTKSANVLQAGTQRLLEEPPLPSPELWARLNSGICQHRCKPLIVYDRQAQVGEPATPCKTHTNYPVWSCLGKAANMMSRVLGGGEQEQDNKTWEAKALQRAARLTCPTGPTSYLYLNTLRPPLPSETPIPLKRGIFLKSH